MAGAAENEVMTVVLIGKTGGGKSSLGNLLLAQKKFFKVGSGLKSETQKCGWGEKQYENLSLTLQVVDTPGLCDTGGSDEDIYKEIAKTVALADYGPHVIIFILRCDRRFTQEEYQAYKTIQGLFSEEMNNFLILVFNGLGNLMETDDDEEEDVKMDEMQKLERGRERLESEIDNFGGSTLEELIRQAKGGYLGMTNRVSPRIMEKQIEELLDKMQALTADNGNKRYSTPTTKRITRKMMKLVKQYVEAHPGVPEAKAMLRIKHDIMEEKVNPSFFTKIIKILSGGATKITKNACVLM